MILLALLILIFLLLVLAWVQRRSIATGFIDRELAKRGGPRAPPARCGGDAAP